MTCMPDILTVSTKVSGTEVRPMSLDLRQSNKIFDYCQAEVTRAAGDHVLDQCQPKEPATVNVAGSPFYYGFINKDNIELGKKTAYIKISDPLRILQSGVIDKEFHNVSLQDIANYVFEHRNDPHNVLKKLVFPKTNPGQSKLQFETSDTALIGYTGSETLITAKQQVLDVAFETLPVLDGDGRFDFREETPLSAMREIAKEFEVDLYDTNSTLNLGNRTAAPNVFGVGQGSGQLTMVDCGIPQDPTPTRAVYVKGGYKTVIADDNTTSMPQYGVQIDTEKVQARAYAKRSVDSEEVIVLENKETTNLKRLQTIAKNALVQDISRSNQGSVTIDVLSSASGAVTKLNKMNPGDQIVIQPGSRWRCKDEVPTGLFNITDVDHQFDARDGWILTLDVSKVVTGGITTKAWWFDPTDPSMTPDQIIP